MSPLSTVMNGQLETPVRFSPSVERPDGDEAKTTQALIATLRYINEKTFAVAVMRSEVCTPRPTEFCRATWKWIRASQVTLHRDCSRSQVAIRL